AVVRFPTGEQESNADLEAALTLRDVFAVTAESPHPFIARGHDLGTFILGLLFFLATQKGVKCHSSNWNGTASRAVRVIETFAHKCSSPESDAIDGCQYTGPQVFLNLRRYVPSTRGPPPPPVSSFNPSLYVHDGVGRAEICALPEPLTPQMFLPRSRHEPRPIGSLMCAFDTSLSRLPPSFRWTKLGQIRPLAKSESRIQSARQKTRHGSSRLK
ncbi:hypothetical protein Bbelb_437600, partial [Branchiostoma belcheri]